MAVACSTLMAFGAHSASAEVPTWIAPEPSDPSGRPLWVSVEVALTTDNSLRSELFSPEFAAAIDRLNQQAEERQRDAQSSADEISSVCTAVVPYDCDQSDPSRGHDPAELYANSRFILAGKVTDRRQGFFRETAGQLLEVVVEETVKAPAAAPAHHSLLLFLRDSTVSLPLRRFCVDGSSRNPPALGAPVLLPRPRLPWRARIYTAIFKPGMKWTTVRAEPWDCRSPLPAISDPRSPDQSVHAQPLNAHLNPTTAPAAGAD